MRIVIVAWVKNNGLYESQVLQTYLVSIELSRYKTEHEPTGSKDIIPKEQSLLVLSLKLLKEKLRLVMVSRSNISRYLREECI